MKIRKTILRAASLLAAAAMMLTGTGCQGNTSDGGSSKVEVASDLRLTVFDVGKADAMVLQTTNCVTVLDTGYKGDGKIIEEFLTGQGISKIDRLIITHFDKDHVGGAARLVNRMEIGEILIPDYVSSSNDFVNFYTKSRDKGMEMTKIGNGETKTWSADDADYTLYAPNEADYGKNEENDFSLGLYVTHGANKLFFSGDAEEPRQQEMMALNLGTVDFLKFPYHGNYLDTTEDFLDAFQPKYTVICCSTDEFADQRTVDTLKNRKIETYYTSSGDITMISDGNELRFTQDMPRAKD